MQLNMHNFKVATFFLSLSLSVRSAKAFKYCIKLVLLALNEFVADKNSLHTIWNISIFKLNFLISLCYIQQHELNVFLSPSLSLVFEFSEQFCRTYGIVRPGKQQHSHV